jgi:hypothetical protein
MCVLDGISDCLFTHFIAETTERIAVKMYIMLYKKKIKLIQNKILTHFFWGGGNLLVAEMAMLVQQIREGSPYLL